MDVVAFELSEDGSRVHLWHKCALPDTDGLVEIALPVGREAWQITSADPLSVTPEIRCGCGLYGFIRKGKWISYS